MLNRSFISHALIAAHMVGVLPCVLAEPVSAEPVVEAKSDDSEKDGSEASDASPREPVYPEPDGVLPGSYNFFRWNDDFTYLNDVETRAGPAKLKRIPLSNDGFVRFSLGGDYRFRIETFDNPIYDLTPATDFTSVQHRFLLNGNIEVDDRVRVFAQLGYFLEDGREPGSLPTDRGDPDIQQLFVDIGLWDGLDQGFIRVGRQELIYGSGRFVSEREGTNIRRSFDAIKLDATQGGYRIQGFVGSPIAPEFGAFDDDGDQDELAWGAYLTRNTRDGFANLDLYYFGRRDDEQTWAQGTAREVRHTLGARVYEKSGAFDFDVEAAYQFGSFGDGRISAWGIASDIGFTFAESGLKPRLGLRANYASGDDDADDPDLQSFNPLYPMLAYFSDDATYAPVNAFDLQPYVRMQPDPALRLEFGADAIFRADGDDAFYGAGPRVLVGPNGEGTQFSTLLLRAKATWDLNPFLTGLISFVHGASGTVIDEAGGRSFNYLLIQLTGRI